MNAAGPRWHQRPVRVCPTAWCRCPHRELGEDPRCESCRRRPAGAERHGGVPTILRSDAWNGEFGCCHGSWLEPEDREVSKADRAACETAAKSLTMPELVTWLESLGIWMPTTATVSDLRLRAANAQMDLWWPRMFVQSREEARSLRALRAVLEKPSLRSVFGSGRPMDGEYWSSVAARSFARLCAKCLKFAQA